VTKCLSIFEFELFIYCKFVQQFLVMLSVIIMIYNYTKISVYSVYSIYCLGKTKYRPQGLIGKNWIKDQQQIVEAIDFQTLVQNYFFQPNKFKFNRREHNNDHH